MRGGKPIRLRDFVRVGDLYFAVLGYRNEKKVKCFLRYAPGDGDRVKGGKRFRKLSHDEAAKVGRRYFDGTIFRVPYEDIDEVFKPEERLSRVMDEEVAKVVGFFERKIPLKKMGVTGSRLIGLKGSESDIDFVVYGRWWFEAREMIRRGIESGKLSEPDAATWDFIYEKRKVPLPFEVFLAHEKRKYHRAFIGSTYFDLLYVRDYEELYRNIPEEPGTRLGRLTIEAAVRDSRYAFDYPAFYAVEHPEISAILCFTHTYAGQVFEGERVLAAGVVEEIEGDRYLIVGTRRETQDEYVVSLDLVERSGLADELRSWLRR